jgi:hypothetical protein
MVFVHHTSEQFCSKAVTGIIAARNGGWGAVSGMLDRPLGWLADVKAGFDDRV